MVESQMIESKPPMSLKNESNLSCTIQSMMVNSKPPQQQHIEDPFEGTIQSEFAATTNKLELLQETIKKNPQALLSDSFLNCTLSLSHDQRDFQKGK
jgi:hypothetical protein